MTTEAPLPDRDFQARLEHQLLEEFRRGERLGLNGRPRRHGIGKLRAAGFTLAGLLVGAGCVATAQHIEDAGQAELLLRQAETNARIAAGRAEAWRQQSARSREQYEIGTISYQELYPTQAEIAAAELQTALADLDVEAIRAGGRPLGDDIAAPLLAGRDFVSERLLLERDANSQQIALLQPMLSMMEARVSAGVSLPRDLGPLQRELGELEAIDEQLGAMLALRRSFLDGDIDAGDAELEHRLLLAMTRRQIAEAQRDILLADADRVRQRVNQGLAPSSETVTLENDIQRADTDVEIAQMEIDLLSATLGR